MLPTKPVTLSLTEWQKRMLRDHLEIKAKPSKLTIGIIDKREWVRYRQPTNAALQNGAFNFYLTDAQIKTVATKLGVDMKISALTLSPEMIESGVVKLR